jgi:hypothetical protein
MMANTRFPVCEKGANVTPATRSGKAMSYKRIPVFSTGDREVRGAGLSTDAVDNLVDDLYKSALSAVPERNCVELAGL